MNLTELEEAPSKGIVVGSVKEKFPGTDATPLLKDESARVWPKRMGVADGGVEIEGVALGTVKV